VIYFAKAEATERVKIGYAANTVRRLAILRTASPFPISLAREIEGDRLTEGWLHRHYAQHRVNREWFAWQPCMATIQPPSIARPEKLGPWVDPMPGEIAALADKLGIKPATKAKWRIRGYVPHKWRLPMLTAARKFSLKISERDFEWRVDSGKAA